MKPSIEVDHRTPRSRGGADYDWNNLAAYCKPHHSAKTMRDRLLKLNVEGSVTTTASAPRAAARFATEKRQEGLSPLMTSVIPAVPPAQESAASVQESAAPVQESGAALDRTSYGTSFPIPARHPFPCREEARSRA